MSISIKELLKLNNINIIDIRSNQKYNDNHIPNSLNVDYESLLLYTSKYLNFNTTYYIYCQKGIQSTKICNILRRKGYKLVNILGGYEAWILEKT